MDDNLGQENQKEEQESLQEQGKATKETGKTVASTSQTWTSMGSVRWRLTFIFGFCKWKSTTQ
jgi:hypothetical protein